MDFFEYTKQKLQCALLEVERLKASDFPQYPESHALYALNEIEKLFLRDLERLERLSPKSDLAIKQSTALQANTNLGRFHPLLGFNLRSTNVRNAFELFDPLFRLTRSLLGTSAKLVLSSEWEFSPFTYAQVFQELADFVFIGLPASESNNSLIIPLAGHELGHTVWRSTGLGKGEENAIQKAVLDQINRRWVDYEAIFGPTDKTKLTTDLVILSQWRVAFQLSLRQCEETFCDLLGLRLFGESYYHSFEYFIAPNVGNGRPYNYPPMNARADFMVQGGVSMGFAAPADYPSKFVETPGGNLSKVDRFLLELSDDATKSMVPKLITLATKYADDRNIALPSPQAQASILASIKAIVPAAHPSSLPDIINAGWQAFLDENFWPSSLVPPNRRYEVLNELTLKTIEVLEYNSRVEP